jgi:hypothetical protein
VAEAMDKINDRWGEFSITPALMMDMDEIILDRIAFGGVKELEEIYESIPLICFFAILLFIDVIDVIDVGGSYGRQI